MNHHADMSPIAAEQAAPVETGQGANAVSEDVTTPNPAATSWWGAIKQKGADLRRGAIEATPAFIVNNSSNFLGAAHVGTEVLMFKSGMGNNKLVDNPGNPVNWVVEPAQKIWKDIYAKSTTRDFTMKELMDGNPVANFKKFATDTQAATEREASRQMARGTAASNVKLGNAWQTRSTFIGFLIWTLSALLPEKKESEQNIEDMATLRTLHPMRYVGERLRQAIDVPHWAYHKRQMIGLGYVGIGICSMLGAWRQRRVLLPELKEDALLIEKGLQHTYTFNKAYFGTGMLNFAASLPLLFALDENKGYSNFGMIMMARIPLVFKSVGQKFKQKDPGAMSYTMGMASFQAENAAQALIGGATKIVKPDGSIEIVNHEEIKQKAKQEAQELKQQLRQNKARYSLGDTVDNLNEAGVASSETPQSVVSNVASIQRAMPEREAPQQAVVTA